MLNSVNILHSLLITFRAESAQLGLKKKKAKMAEYAKIDLFSNSMKNYRKGHINLLDHLS
jgi:hypothetical protein